MGEALYRKYRPKKLDDVVGQPHITTTLTNAIQNGRISHGYLFSGPRGVGKTSVARILAHQVNDFDYGDSRGALDIIEIDAASNRRIDEIRDLRDKVHTAPVAGKYKVYIIDEVHMLTREAFNALLKTLEEPPAHVIFILATTEVHKLPETIVSRTQRYTFKAVSENEVIAHLQNLAKQEDITISDDALKLVASHGEGSFRDSISLLDQLSIQGTVNDDDVRRLLGLPPAELVGAILDAINDHDISATISILDGAFIQGISPNQIATALVDKIRSQIITQPNTGIIELARQLLKTNASTNPARYLELALADYIFTAKPNQTTNRIADAQTPHKHLKTPVAESKPAKISEPKAIKKAEPQSKPPAKKSEAKQVIQEATSTGDLSDMLADGLWDTFLSALKKKYNTLYGLARMAEPTTEEGTLILSVPFAFHQKRLSEEKNAAIIRTTLIEIIGSPIVIRVEVANTKKEATLQADSEQQSDTLNTVTQIFGGGEVLET